MDLLEKLIALRSEMENFYSADFSSEQAEEAENMRIKHQIADLIIMAHERNATEISRQALYLLAENTGCMEDYLIFQKITNRLLIKGIFSQKEIDVATKQSSISRWI